MSAYSQMGDHVTRPHYETFSYLPPLTAEEINVQVAYILAQGWTPSIEHEHPSKAAAYYWPMWKLPMFGVTDVREVLEEVEACRRAYPDHHVRLVGYDNYAQVQGTALVVVRAR